MSDYLTIKNKKIYYEMNGDAHLPVFLYLHGGTEAGSYDFIEQQSQELSKFMRVIAIDQRGVLRSDPIKDEETFRILDLTDDCEIIRHQQLTGTEL